MNVCHDFRYGKIIYNTLDIYVGKSLKEYGEYCQEEANIFSLFVHEGDCVIEVGANIGSHTVHLAQLAGESGAVYAFEPQRLVFQLLAGNIALNSLTNVYCEQKCVSDSPGKINVPLFDVHQLANWGGMPLENDWEGEPVDVITLDSLGITRCDFLKVDVEGMELQVLKGGEKMINACKPVIYAEADREDKKKALFTWISEHGYSIYSHNPSLFNPDNYFGNPENVFIENGRQVLSYNVLCVPRGKFSIEGLKEVSEW